MYERLIFKMKNIDSAETLSLMVKSGLKALNFIFETIDRDTASITNQLVGLIFYDIPKSWKFFFENAVLETNDGVVKQLFENLFEPANSAIKDTLNDMTSLYGKID